jgi:hypothetical protein
VVDGTGLENRHTRKGIGGSNPSLSAILLANPIFPDDIGQLRMSFAAKNQTADYYYRDSSGCFLITNCTLVHSGKLSPLNCAENTT